PQLTDGNRLYRSPRRREQSFVGLGGVVTVRSAADEPRRPGSIAETVRLPRSLRHGDDLVAGDRPASTFRDRDGDIPIRGKRPLRRYDRSDWHLAGRRR